MLWINRGVLDVLGESAIALHDVLGEPMILFIVVNQLLQHAVKDC